MQIFLFPFCVFIVAVVVAAVAIHTLNMYAEVFVFSFIAGILKCLDKSQ